MLEQVLVTRYLTKEVQQEVITHYERNKELNIFDIGFDITQFDTVPVYSTVTVKQTDTSQTITQSLTLEGLNELYDQGKIERKRFNSIEGSLRLESPIYLYTKEEIENSYSIFKIPKASGGLRTIKAPKEELKDLQKQWKYILESVLRVLPHNNAFAYIKNRSVKNALEVHQANESKWFLKLDFKDFFDNCTPDFISRQLRKLHPFASWSEEEFYTFIQLLNQVAILDNGLPQGTPLSPTLTNLIMVEFDKWMTGFAYKHGLRYTRYADDLLISSKINFDFERVQNSVLQYLHENEYPFSIKVEKTRYGSANGSNWNLGLMLNKDNEITIGHKNKKNLKRAMYYFHKQPGVPSYEEATELLGNMEWLRSNQPEAYKGLITWFNKKYNTDIRADILHVIKYATRRQTPTHMVEQLSRAA